MPRPELSIIRHDVIFAVRQLARRPGFTGIVVLVLALGIGATTAIFSVVNAAMLRPLPYPAPGQLVVVTDSQSELGEAPSSYPEYLDWKAQTQVFSDIAGYFDATLTLTGHGDPEVLSGVRVSAALPRMLGAAPRIGRAFLPEEESPAAERVIMIGEELWRRRFNADARVIGQTLTLSGLPYTVVGVVPSTARSVLPHRLATGRHADFWAPLRLDPQQAGRGLHFMSILGRLRPELGEAEARKRMETVAARLRAEGVTEHGVHIAGLAARVVRNAKPLLLLLLGGVTMVLLTACANVANLLLTRATARRREVAIRSALGAARTRIIRQLLTESVLVALLGGAVGVVLAYWAIHALRALQPENLPRFAEAGIDGRILAFALALSIATGIAFGLAPAIRATRNGLGEMLREGGRGATGGIVRDRVRSALVVTEVALSFMLLIGAGLLIRSLDRLLAVPTGFDAERVLSLELDLPGSRYPGTKEQIAFYRQALDRVSALPGVQGTAVVSSLPIEGGVNGGFAIEGRTFPADAQPLVEKRIASADYFAVMRVPLVAGRFLDARDVAGAPQTVIVNESFQRRYFPNESAVGKRVDFSWGTTGLQEIVGVVGDMKEEALDQAPSPAMYIPFAQRPEPSMQLVLRTAGQPSGVVAAVRAAIYGVDRDQAIVRVRTLEEVVAGALAGRKMSTSLFGLFSMAALLLAGVGLYAVISYSVLQRTKEIGVRMALGAQRGDLLRLVLGHGLVLIAVGVVAGAAGALALGRLLSGLLFGIAPADPATYAGVTLLLATVALLASLVPALRAARVDPLVALRSE
jgi:putative ABC transport system permease protein